MPNNPRKLLLDQFVSHLADEFGAYCERHGADRTDTSLLTFLVDQELVPKTAIQRYVVRKEFEALLPDGAATKTQAVAMLAHRFNISERTVWSILKHSKQKP